MRRLPLLAERAIGDIKAMQTQMGAAFESALRTASVQPICKSGCSNCCSHPFLISIAEGVLLYRALVSNRTWTKVRKRVEETRELTLGLNFEVWLMSNIQCPVLRENRTCGAYDSRPLHCRVTYSTGDSDLCHPHMLGAGTPLIDNADTVVQFSKEVRTVLKKIGAHGTLMPLAEALLLGEMIDTGKLPVEESDLQFARDLYGS
jgi:Fe-S-cluster containining protein